MKIIRLNEIEGNSFLDFINDAGLDITTKELEEIYGNVRYKTRLKRGIIIIRREIFTEGLKMSSFSVKISIKEIEKLLKNK